MPYDRGNTDRGKPSAGAVAKPHSLSLSERRRLRVSGVEEMERFDEREIAMRTSGGELFIGGEELSVGRLDLDAGEVDILGLVSSLRYEDAAASGGFWSRLFS
ncbi:MAG: sporulation protein [Oscillospiraceae bacterium]|nr:sporulation protein [Oscillospiraceae bacterium]